MVTVNVVAVLIGAVLFTGWAITAPALLKKQQKEKNLSIAEKIAYIFAVFVFPLGSVIVSFYFIGEAIVNFVMWLE